VGSAYLVLGAVYHLAVGKLAAIAEAAAYIELSAMGDATSLHHPGGIAALQPEVGCRGPGGGEPSRKSERDRRDGQFHFPLPLSKNGRLLVPNGRRFPPRLG